MRGMGMVDRLGQALERYRKGSEENPWQWRGLEFVVEPRSAIAHEVRRNGAFESSEIDIAAALYLAHYKGRCIVDVGANIGLHSVAWSHLAPVVALEPAPATFARLEANVAANGLQDRIRRIRTAVSDTPGEADFFVTADSAFSSLKDTKRIAVTDRVRVPVTTLDKLAAELSPVGLLKIDVEGFERSVIAGAGDLLRRDFPVLFVEIYGGTASNPDPEGTIADICALGYSPLVYGRNVGVVPFDGHRDDRYNYFFVPAVR